MTYEYNAQVHRTTGTTPFSLALTRHPPSQIIETITPKDPSGTKLKGTKATRMAILDRLRSLFDTTDRRAHMTREAYKWHFDKKVRREPKFKIGDYVFIDRPKTEPKTAKEKESNIAKSKLQPKGTGPYLVVKAYTAVLVVLDDGNRLPVSIDRCTWAPPPRTPPPDPNHRRRTRPHGRYRQPTRPTDQI